MIYIYIYMNVCWIIEDQLVYRTKTTCIECDKLITYV